MKIQITFCVVNGGDDLFMEKESTKINCFSNKFIFCKFYSCLHKYFHKIFKRKVSFFENGASFSQFFWQHILQEKVIIFPKFVIEKKNINERK